LPRRIYLKSTKHELSWQNTEPLNSQSKTCRIMADHRSPHSRTPRGADVAKWGPAPCEIQSSCVWELRIQGRGGKNLLGPGGFLLFRAMEKGWMGEVSFPITIEKKRNSLGGGLGEGEGGRGSGFRRVAMKQRLHREKKKGGDVKK